MTTKYISNDRPAVPRPAVVHHEDLIEADKKAGVTLGTWVAFVAVVALVVIVLIGSHTLSHLH
jgi:hypothetical protein